MAAAASASRCGGNSLKTPDSGNNRFGHQQASLPNSVHQTARERAGSVCGAVLPSMIDGPVSDRIGVSSPLHVSGVRQSALLVSRKRAEVGT
jgi:hypothetical protein